MVQIQFRYEGDLRCRAVHAPSTTEVLSDAPVDNQGRGESFSPTDLVATALGACMLTIMGIVARDRDWDIVGATATVEKGMTGPPRRIGRLAVDIRVPKDPGPEGRTALEEAARGCPVARSLHADIETPLTFHWG